MRCDESPFGSVRTIKTRPTALRRGGITRAPIAPAAWRRPGPTNLPFLVVRVWRFCWAERSLKQLLPGDANSPAILDHKFGRLLVAIDFRHSKYDLAPPLADLPLPEPTDRQTI